MSYGACKMMSYKFSEHFLLISGIYPLRRQPELVMLMSGYVKPSHAVSSLMTLKSMRRAPLDDEWSRFLMYAQRIREFYTASRRTRIAFCIGPDAIRHFAVFRPTFVLFPRLQKLSWPLRGVSTEDIGLFVSPSLLSITATSGTFTLPILNCIQRVASGLQSIALSYGAGYIEPGTFTAIQNLICHAGVLQSFTCEGSLTAETARHLGSMVSLKHLEIHIKPADVATGIWHSLDISPASFAALQEVSLLGKISTCIAFLSVTRFSPIRIFNADISDNQIRGEDLEYLMGTLQEHQSGSLEQLSVVHVVQRQVGFFGDIAPIANNLGNARPQMRRLSSALSRLTTVIISSGRLADITDAQLGELAMSWPGLKILSMDVKGTRLTSRSLAALAELCPLLQKVLIPIDLGNKPIFCDDFPQLGSRILAQLERVDLVHSQIENLEELALLLADLCPNLSEVRWSRKGPRTESVDQGGELWRLVRLCQRTREHLRARMG